MIKKLLIFGTLGVVVLVLAVVVFLNFFLDSSVERAVEKVGPRFTQTTVEVGSVNLSPFSGAGTIKGLVVGNPEGFKTPYAIKMGNASMALQPSSLLKDKIVIHSINVQGPEVTFETDLQQNNLSKIMANVEQVIGTEESTKKFQVDELAVKGGIISVNVSTLGGKSVSVPLPDIYLKDLGTGPEGITAADLTRQVLKAIINTTLPAAQAAVSEIAKGAVTGITTDLTKDAEKAAADAAGKVTKGLGDLLKKK
jgi:uncharacterized protein involved in outer membrane biogenesis